MLRLHSGLVTLLCCSGLAHAAEGDGTFELGRIEVNASAPSARDSSVEQVSAEEMRQFERENVAQALNLLPGVALSVTGNRFEQQVYLRGFDARQVPVFIDGVPVYVPYDGNLDLGRFSTADLATIEVAKGFSSLLYGPNGMGGSINLVTRKPTKELEGQVSAGLNWSDGEGQTAYHASLDVGSRFEQGYLQLNAAYLNRDFYGLSDDFSATQYEDGGKRENSYNSDRRLGLKAGYTPNAKDEYVLGYSQQHGQKGSPPYTGSDPTFSPRYWQWPYWDKESVFFASTTALNNSTLKTRVYYDSFKNSLAMFDDASYTTQKKSSSGTSYYDDYTSGASVEWGTPLAENNTLKVAAHVKQDVHRERNANQPQGRFEDITYSLALEDTHRLSEQLELIGGLSFDRRTSEEARNYNTSTKKMDEFADNSANALNWQLGAFYHTSPTGIARATIAERSRFATLKERYTTFRPGTGQTVIINPDLDPERALNLELGWSETFFDSTRIDMALFHSRVEDYIQSANITPTLVQNQNVGTVTFQGFELGLRSALNEQVELGANYTHLLSDNDDSDLVITGIPKNKLLVWGRWQATDQLSLQASNEYNSKRYSSTDGRRVADGFNVVNTRAEYQLNQQLSVAAGVNNLFDEDYAYNEGFPEEGRNFFLNVDYQF